MTLVQDWLYMKSSKKGKEDGRRLCFSNND